MRVCACVRIFEVPKNQKCKRRKKKKKCDRTENEGDRLDKITKFSYSLPFEVREMKKKQHVATAVATDTRAEL